MCRYKEWTAYKMLKGGGIFLIGMTMAAVLASCGNQAKSSNSGSSGTSDKEIMQKIENAHDLVESNPDIFGWIIIPDTGIDYPLAQNLDGDDTYYETHDITGKKKSKKGGIYIKSFNMNDMCDFNTVIYGATTKDGDMFSELWNFADENFFNKHDTLLIAIEDNILTYEVWTAYARDNTDVMQQYDFTEKTECQQYLYDMKKDWTSATNIRSGWEDGVTPDNFLVSLVTVDSEHPDKQWVVVGCLVEDQNGTINRETLQFDE